PIKTVHPSGAVDSSSYNASGLPTFIQTGDATNRRVIAYGGWAQRVSASGGPQPAMQAYLGVNGRVDSAWTGSCCSKTKYLYDSRGQVVSTTDPQGHLLGKHWYAGINGNHSRDSLPGGWITTYSYDAFGRDTAVTGPLAPVRRAHYDVLNRPIQFYDGVYASPTAVAYDSMGHTRSVTDEKGQVYGFTYNALGWLTARTDPTGHADTLKYNRDGQVLRQINRRGQTVSFAYDALHRDTSKTGTNTDTDRWSYSTDGRV